MRFINFHQRSEIHFIVISNLWYIQPTEISIKKPFFSKAMKIVGFHKALIYQLCCLSARRFVREGRLCNKKKNWNIAFSPSRHFSFISFESSLRRRKRENEKKRGKTVKLIEANNEVSKTGYFNSTNSSETYNRMRLWNWKLWFVHWRYRLPRGLPFKDG